jgi:zinc-binding alcohol dehydrogenase/oxidoreductase
VVVDNVGAATLNDSIRSLKRGGRIVLVGNTSGPHVQIDLRYFFTKQISLIGSTMGNHDDYRQIMQLVFAGKIQPPIETILPLSEGTAGMALLEQNQQFGKVVLSR